MQPKNANTQPVQPPPAAARAAPATRDQLPPLDLLRSFEAAARHLSFTLAGRELFLTQSAVSRQIQQVEASLGVALFNRHHRALELTEAGQVLQRAVVDCLERLRDATARVRASSEVRHVAITCTAGFASLWLIPRLAGFTAVHPQVDVRISATSDVLDLDRSRIDLAVRFCPIADGVGAPLFEETVLPVCSPRLAADRANPLKRPADLERHTLLAVDMQGMALTVDWEPWARVMNLPELRMKNTVRFSQYADVISAAVAGQGVAIGRLPLLAGLLRSRQLVAPFGGGAASQRGYYVITSGLGRANPDAADFEQ
ncbi:MAG TPA: LysR substrate-binding domain-containing protein, partial [Ramlibacter sp.]|nr:LysR substrate-binding domain-containing protein [Ramlibacter sp.]